VELSLELPPLPLQSGRRRVPNNAQAPGLDSPPRLPCASRSRARSQSQAVPPAGPNSRIKRSKRENVFGGKPGRRPRPRVRPSRPPAGDAAVTRRGDAGGARCREDSRGAARSGPDPPRRYRCGSLGPVPKIDQPCVPICREHSLYLSQAISARSTRTDIKRITADSTGKSTDPRQDDPCASPPVDESSTARSRRARNRRIDSVSVYPRIVVRRDQVMRDVGEKSPALRVSLQELARFSTDRHPLTAQGGRSPASLIGHAPPGPSAAMYPILQVRQPGQSRSRTNPNTVDCGCRGKAMVAAILRPESIRSLGNAGLHLCSPFDTGALADRRAASAPPEAPGCRGGASPAVNVPPMRRDRPQQVDPSCFSKRPRGIAFLRGDRVATAERASERFPRCRAPVAHRRLQYGAAKSRAMHARTARKAEGRNPAEGVSFRILRHR
jgi:hypothetical protein